MPPTPGEPSRNPFLQFIVWLYDQTWFHWVVSFLAQPIYSLMGLLYRLENLIRPIDLWKDWQNRPEPKYPIPLTKNDLPVKTRLCDDCGNYVGTLIGTYVDAEQVKKILPPGTSLDPAHIHNGQHAMIMLFGYTEDLHFGWWPFRSMNYLECGVAVPHIRIDDNVRIRRPLLLHPHPPPQSLLPGAPWLDGRLSQEMEPCHDDLQHLHHQVALHRQKYPACRVHPRQG